MFTPVVLPSVLQGRQIPRSEFSECSGNVLRAAFIPHQGTAAPQDLRGNRGPRSSRICSGPAAAVVLPGARLPSSRPTWAYGPPEAGERCSSSAKEAKPKVIASAQRITFHFNSIQIHSTRVYCTPSIMARRGRGTYKTRLLPSGSLITSNLINHPDVEAAREYGGARPRAAPTEPSEVCNVDVFQAGINHCCVGAPSQPLLNAFYKEPYYTGTLYIIFFTAHQLCTWAAPYIPGPIN